VRRKPNRTSTALSRATRLAAVLLVTLSVAVTTACGMSAQTTKPYTPSEGINVDVGGYAGVKVRNLLVLSRTDGEGYLSGTVVSQQRNSLTAVSGKAIKSDGTDGAQITATIPQQISLGNGLVVVLTSQQLIVLKSPDLKAGLTAQLTLEFSESGQVTVVVPVVDAKQPPYSTISPEPTPQA
jgi:hypothetical protein